VTTLPRILPLSITVIPHGGVTAQEGLSAMVQLATTLNLCIEANVNDVTVFASPGDDPVQLHKAYLAAFDAEPPRFASAAAFTKPRKPEE